MRCVCVVSCVCLWALCAMFVCAVCVLCRLSDIPTCAIPACACGLGWACGPTPGPTLVLKGVLNHPLDVHSHSHRHRHRRDTQTPKHLLKVLNLRRLSSCRTTSMSFLQASCS